MAQKVQAEHQFRELLRSQEMPQPDEVEYGLTCIRFFFEETKTCIVLDIDDPELPENAQFDEDLEADLADLDDEDEEWPGAA